MLLREFNVESKEIGIPPQNELNKSFATSMTFEPVIPAYNYVYICMCIHIYILYVYKYVFK